MSRATSGSAAPLQEEEQGPPRKVVLSVKRDPEGNAKHRGRPRAGVSQRAALNVDVTVTDGRTSGPRGLPEGLPCMPGAVLATCPRQIWGSGSRAESGVLCTAEANKGGLEVDALPHWPR